MLKNKMLFRMYAADPVTGGGSVPAEQSRGEEKTPNVENKPSAFDEFLSDSKNQAEFDRRVSKALETAKTSFENQKQAAITEALKLQKMTEEQKFSYEQQQAQKQLAEKEAELTRRELKLNAINALTEKDLPVDLVDSLSYDSKESYEKSMARVTKAFEKAVSKAIDARLRQPPPKAGDQNPGDAMAAIRAAAGLK